MFLKNSEKNWQIKNNYVESSFLKSSCYKKHFTVQKYFYENSNCIATYTFKALR